MPSEGILRTYWPASIGKGGAPCTSNSILIQPVYPSGIRNREERRVEFAVPIASNNPRAANDARVRAAMEKRTARLADSGKIQLSLPGFFWLKVACLKLTMAE
jgi:hypothetical protein